MKLGKRSGNIIITATDEGQKDGVKEMRKREMKRFLEWKDRKMERWKDRRMEGWKDGWVDGLMDGWMDRKMEGWLDGYKERKHERYRVYDVELLSSSVLPHSSVSYRTTM
jgi:hypothetical protein